MPNHRKLSHCLSCFFFQREINLSGTLYIHPSFSLSLIQTRLPWSACRRNPSFAVSGVWKQPALSLSHSFLLRGRSQQRGGRREEGRGKREEGRGKREEGESRRESAVVAFICFICLHLVASNGITATFKD